MRRTQSPSYGRRAPGARPRPTERQIGDRAFIDENAQWLTLREMCEMVEDVQNRVPLPSALSKERPLSQRLLQTLERLSRSGVVLPWDKDRDVVLELCQLGYVEAVPVRSDNIAGGAGLVRCALTALGERVMDQERARFVRMRDRQTGGRRFPGAPPSPSP